MNILPVGDELLHTDGQEDGRTDGWTDMPELTVAFRNFANAPRIHSLPDTYLYEIFSLFLCELTTAMYFIHTLHNSCTILEGNTLRT
jgi:hypothetical protein